MTVMTRTDIHRPGSPDFDPQAYDLIDVYDLHTESGDHRFLNTELDKLAKAGIVRGGNPPGCGHCGQTNLRFVALLIHTGAREWIFVGQDCLAGRFLSQTKVSFAALRKAAELDRKKQAVKAAWLALCEANPGIAYASYAADIIDAYISAVKDSRDAVHIKAGADWALGILADIARKARRNGSASDKQIAFVERLWAEIDQKLAAYATRTPEPEVPPAPEGKVTVTGEIVHTRWQENDFGGSVKMLVVADEGWKVWSTLPGAISGADKGDRVRFTATLTRSDDDPAFAYARRPAGAEILPS